jgi:hypothetical protein
VVRKRHNCSKGGTTDVTKCSRCCGQGRYLEANGKVQGREDKAGLHGPHTAPGTGRANQSPRAVRESVLGQKMREEHTLPRGLWLACKGPSQTTARLL